ncbi:unnamed protein product [Urochloa decumbens]|uniref:Uncharacterized protein n=1 Tax=Urochloa decumbens TaxID=240449 RepID=A0ABC8Z6M0_9POAL
MRAWLVLGGRFMRPARRGGGAVGASARALLLPLLLLLLLIGSRGAEAIRAVPRRNRSHSHGHGARTAVLLRKAMPLPGTRPAPVRLVPVGSEEESKRRIPSCPDPLHNR